MTLTRNFWIIWMVVSMFAITIVGWKQKFVTTKIRRDRVTVIRIPKKYVRIGVWVATIIMSILIIGETIYTYNELETVGFDDLWSTILFIVFIIPGYNLALRIIFNQAREAHEAEMMTELKGE